MNARRLAELHREQARLAAEQARVAAELADAFEAEDVPAPPKSKPRKTKRRGAPSYPAPLRDASDLAKMRAQKMMRERGIG